MLSTPPKKLSILKLGEILLKIHDGEDLKPVYAQLSAAEMKELRNFLEEELLYLSSLEDEAPLTLTEIKSRYEPVPNYYYQQDCREPLESCLNETCLASNPTCFTRKIKSHIHILIQLISPFFGKQ